MSAGVNIVVDPQKWPLKGLTNPPFHMKRLRLVAASSSEQLWRYCEPRDLAQIVVYSRKEGPLCDFNRDSKGRIRIGLNAYPDPDIPAASGSSLNDYSKMAFQLAHEFCHVIAVHSREGQRHDNRHPNHWLEESLCETASLFALRKMAVEWPQHPEYAHWTTGEGKPYAPSLQTYAQNRIDSALLRVAFEEDFQAWFERREPFLRDHPIAIEKDERVEKQLRDDYTVIATRLLPLLEVNPESWEAVSFLNLTPHRDNKPLVEHLDEWKSACPAQHRPFVASLEHLFLPSNPRKAAAAVTP